MPIMRLLQNSLKGREEEKAVEPKNDDNTLKYLSFM